MKVDEVAAELGVSNSYAYKLIRELNKELKAAGCIVINTARPQILPGKLHHRTDRRRDCKAVRNPVPHSDNVATIKR